MLPLSITGTGYSGWSSKSLKQRKTMIQNNLNKYNIKNLAMNMK